VVYSDFSSYDSASERSIPTLGHVIHPIQVNLPVEVYPSSEEGSVEDVSIYKTLDVEARAAHRGESPSLKKFNDCVTQANRRVTSTTYKL
jgi:hypothetical protein